METDDGVKRVLSCRFVSWCKDHPEEVTEPLWYALLSNLVRLRGGYSLSHEYSRRYPRYSRSETDHKIHQALDASNPHTCRYIGENGFECMRDCGVKSPAALAYKRKEFNGDAGKRIRISIG
jgi:putative DNA primase/helicase